MILFNKKVIFLLKTVVLIFACFVSDASFAGFRIYELDQVSKAQSSLYTADLVILDIDNTLARPAQTLGSDQWFQYRMLQYKKRGLTDQDALERTITDNIQVQQKTEVHPSEKLMVDLANRIGQRRWNVLILTARTPRPVYVDITLNQLRKIGLKIPYTPPTRTRQVDLKCASLCFEKNGVLFTGANPKGDVLKLWLQKTGFRARNIVMLDDRIANIQSVQSMLEHPSSPLSPPIYFTGLRYSYLDPWVKSFRPEIADRQWASFILNPNRRILSDREALSYLPMKNKKLLSVGEL